LVVVPAAAVLLAATSDAAADEVRRNTIVGEAVACAALAMNAANLPWIAGEVLEFRDAADAWPPKRGKKQRTVRRPRRRRDARRATSGKPSGPGWSG